MAEMAAVYHLERVAREEEIAHLMIRIATLEEETGKQETHIRILEEELGRDIRPNTCTFASLHRDERTPIRTGSRTPRYGRIEQNKLWICFIRERTSGS
jgi:hypothetical protein